MAKPTSVDQKIISREEGDKAFENLLRFKNGNFIEATHALWKFLDVLPYPKDGISWDEINEKQAVRLKLLASPNYNTILKAFEIQQEAKK